MVADEVAHAEHEEYILLFAIGGGDSLITHLLYHMGMAADDDIRAGFCQLLLYFKE